MDSKRKLTIPTPLLDQILSHVASTAPDEACGLLGGAGGIVNKVFAVPNRSLRPEVSYTMDSASQVRALLEMERGGWELVAIYHSHPHGYPAQPSESDMRQITYPAALMLIVAPLRSNDWDVRAYDFSFGNLREARLLIQP